MDKQPSIVLAGAARTAIGSFGGGLADVSAHKLGAITIQAALERAKTAKDEVDDVILGQVLTAGQGQNPARQAAIEAGIAQQTPAMTLNQVCGSGLRTVALGAQQIACGDADIVVTGGQENMSLSTHCMHLRKPKKMGDGAMLDTMISDGLWDAFNSYHMGQTAENIAQKWQISREIQDDFALRSQQNAEKAQASGKFAEEIVPVTISSRKGDVTIDQDEYIRHGATLESLTKLRPAFAREGSVTAGNASGINDGAAAIILMSEANAEARGVEPLGRIVSWASAGVDPAIMGTGPIPASQKALKRAGWTVDMLDLVEANEAFAAQACAVNQEMGWDTAKVNVNGGAIALGHPIGASGARILVTLLFEMRRRDAKRGLATLCIGGGMGVSVCVER